MAMPKLSKESIKEAAAAINVNIFIGKEAFERPPESPYYFQFADPI